MNSVTCRSSSASTPAFAANTAFSSGRTNFAVLSSIPEACAKPVCVSHILKVSVTIIRSVLCGP